MSENDGGGVLGDPSSLTPGVVTLPKRQSSQVDHLELGPGSIVTLGNGQQHYVTVSSSVSQDNLSLDNLDSSRISQHVNGTSVTPLHSVGPSSHNAYNAIEYVPSPVVALQDDQQKFPEGLVPVPVNNVDFVEMNDASMKGSSGPSFEFYFDAMPTTSANSTQVPQTSSSYLPRHEHQTPKAQLLVRAYSDFIQSQEQQQQQQQQAAHQQQINIHVHQDQGHSTDHPEAILPDVLEANFVQLEQAVIPQTINDYRKPLKMESQKRHIQMQVQQQKQIQSFGNDSLNVEHNQKLILEPSIQSHPETLYAQQEIQPQEQMKEQAGFQVGQTRYQVIHKQLSPSQKSFSATECLIKEELLNPNMIVQYTGHLDKTLPTNNSNTSSKQTGKELPPKSSTKVQSEYQHHLPLVSRSGRPIRRRPEYIEYVSQNLKDEQMQNINKNSRLIKIESNNFTFDDDEDEIDDEENGLISNDDDQDQSGTYSSDGKKSLPHKKRIPKKLKNAKKHVKCYKCVQCREQFINQSHFNQHKQMHNQSVATNKQTQQFNCEICTKRCDSQLKFFEHLKSHYEPFKKHKCEACAGEFGSAEQLQEHSLVHLKEHFKCNVCHKTFRKESMLEVHVKVAHLEDENSSVEKPYNCSACQKSYRSQLTLDAHVQTDHSDNPPEFNCEDCYRVFKSKAKLLSHRKLEHKEEMSHTRGAPKKKMRVGKSVKGAYACNSCPRTFTHKNSLIYHIRSHTGERPHQCEHCGKAFFAASALKVHLRLHSGEKPYKCDVCGKFFRQWGDLRYHTSSVHSDDRLFQCEFCGKDFKRKYCLVVHTRIHTGEKKYKCEYCPKSFRASSYLQNHRRIHTGERPYPCPDCGKPFRVRSDMKRHRNTHTRDVANVNSNSSAPNTASNNAVPVAVSVNSTPNTNPTSNQTSTLVTSQPQTIIARQNTHSQGQVQIVQGSVASGQLGQLIIADGVPTVIGDQNQPIRIMVSGLSQQSVNHGIQPPPAHRHSQVTAVSMSGAIAPGSPNGASNLSSTSSSLPSEVIIMDESNNQPINLNILPRMIAQSTGATGHSNAVGEEEEYQFIPSSRNNLEMREEGDVCVWSGVQVFTN